MIKTVFMLKVAFTLFFSGMVFSKETYVVSIGNSINQIWDLAGKADSIQIHDADEVTGMGTTQLHAYSGAHLDFHEGKNGFYLWKVEITSSEWAYSDTRIKIGQNSVAVLNALGEPASTELQNKKTIWLYYLKEFDGWLRIEFQNDKINKILAVEDWT